MIPGIKNIQALIITVIIFVSGIAQAQMPYISVNIPLHNCYMDGIKAYGTTGTSLVLAGSSTDVNGITLVQISNSATTTVSSATGTESWSSTERVLPYLDDGLVFYAKLDEPNGTNVIKDSSRYGISGTNTGSAGTTTAKYGRARYFDGVDDKITFPDSDQYDFGTGSFSFGGHYMFTQAAQIGRYLLWKSGVSAGYPGYHIYYNGTQITATLTDDGTGWRNIQLVSSVVNNTPMYIFVVVDRIGLNLKGYVNGIQVGTVSLSSMGSGSSTSNSYPLILGNNVGSGYPFKGYIDEVRIYNRALSQAEITQLYQLTTPDILNTFSATASDIPSNQGTDTIHVGRFPTVSTTDATTIARNSAMLNGTCSANLNTSTAWFEYGLSSGNYIGSSTTAQVTGDTDTPINISLGALNKNTEYFYRLRGSNLVGETYGEEFSFTTLAGYTLEEVTGINKPLSWSLLETTKFLYGLRNYGIIFSKHWRSTADILRLIADPDNEITTAINNP